LASSSAYSRANAIPSCPVPHKNSEFTHSNLISEYKLQTFKSNEKSVRLMLNKRETVLSALVVVSVILVASSFAISFVQQALAQGSNMSSSGGNATSAGHKDNPGQGTSGGPTTSGGQMTGGGY
jgi:uncharacterized membrane protein